MSNYNYHGSKMTLDALFEKAEKKKDATTMSKLMESSEEDVPYYPAYKHPWPIITCASIRVISTCAYIPLIFINQ